MVAFASLILSLVVGTQPVELLVGDGVVAVELRLDGRLVERLDGPPWSTRLDVGEELAPRRLEAVALDAEGGELDRAEQWLNLPRPAAEVSVVLENLSSGRGAVARVAWRNLFGGPPTGVKASLDGRSLEVDDPRRIALPPFDPASLHLLRVDLLFPEGVVSTAEVTFGGVFGEKVSTDLTAVPLVLEKGSRLPPPRELRRWFELAEGSPEVLAVEEGPVELVAVVSDAARGPIEELVEIGRARSRRLGPLQGVARLDREHHLRFVNSRPLGLLDGGVTVQIFPASQVFDRRDSGLLRLLHEVRPKLRIGPERLTDSVAAAALAAARQNRRRGVLLVLGREGADASGFGADRVRRYLARVRVPLTVWRIGERGPDASPWPVDEVVESPWELAAAYRRLAARLERQRLVWLRGAHLPQGVELTPAARGVRLAGVEAVRAQGAAAGSGARGR
ncbi:MAG: hypothetical protein R3325_10285 [Thermoanaerobaculia bacterium]|nr:hypothetical protein [Thermoanaerobaculia bacterium]